MQNISIVTVEDYSVQKKIEKVAEKLRNQYSLKKTEVKSKRIHRSKNHKIFSVCFDVVSIFLVVVCAFMCFSIINSMMQKTPPTYLGYSIMRVSSGSMKASGFEIGDYIAIKAVDEKTLKIGDKIAFYQFSESYQDFHKDNCSLINNQQIEDLKYDNSPKTFFGLQENDLVKAASSGAKLVFHEIVKVVEDDQGNRWFQTKGTSNTNVDKPFICESMVVGIYKDDDYANFIASMVGRISSSSISIFLLVLIPVILIAGSIVKECSRDFNIAKIENDIVRGKRKLTDKICIENNIGPNLSKKEKLKVLAQATEKEKLVYLNLLWPKEKPEHIQKYYLRRSAKTKEYRDKFLLHKRCEKKFAMGEDMNSIASYYLKEKNKIEKNQVKVNKKLKKTINSNTKKS